MKMHGRSLGHGVSLGTGDPTSRWARMTMRKNSNAYRLPARLVLGVLLTSIGMSCTEAPSSSSGPGRGGAGGSAATCQPACAAGEACVSGACQCVPGLNRCPSGCTDVGSDGDNCGTCGNACGS